MKTSLLIVMLLFSGATALGQINMADSTAQVISYWNKGEKQSYTVSTQSIKIRNADTTARYLTSYDVEVTVLDSNATSYTMEWLCKNFKTTHANTTFQKVMEITKNLKVIYKTNELGVFEGVENWKEIQSYIKNAVVGIGEDFKNVPGSNEVLKQIVGTYSTKEAIETAAVKDILQLHSFNGIKYKLNEVIEATIKVPNIYGGEPFDSDITAWLDEINSEDNNIIVRSKQAVNVDQLTEATYSYLLLMAQNMKVSPPRRDEIKDLKNEFLTASRIHGSGWVIYSIQTTTIVSDNVTNVEERIIEIM